MTEKMVIIVSAVYVVVTSSTVNGVVAVSSEDGIVSPLLSIVEVSVAFCVVAPNGVVAFATPDLVVTEVAGNIVVSIAFAVDLVIAPTSFDVVAVIVVFSVAGVDDVIATLGENVEGVSKQ